MSEKYKRAMDQITVSDQLKERIIATAAERLSAQSPKRRNKPVFYLRHAVTYAVCFALCLTVVLTGKNYLDNSNLALDSDHASSIASAAPENTDKGQTFDADHKESNKADSEKSSKPNSQQAAGQTADVNKGAANSEPAPIIPTVPNESSDHYLLTGSEPNTITNPVHDAGSISQLKEQLSYELQAPQWIPENYEIDSVSLLGSMVQISYKSQDDTILYRTQDTQGDISGDYNVYHRVEKIQVNHTEVTLRGSDSLYYNAIWTDGNSYSIRTSKGMDKDTLKQIIESVACVDSETKKAEK